MIFYFVVSNTSFVALQYVFVANAADQHPLLRRAMPGTSCILLRMLRLSVDRAAKTTPADHQERREASKLPLTFEPDFRMKVFALPILSHRLLIVPRESLRDSED